MVFQYIQYQGHPWEPSLADQALRGRTGGQLQDGGSQAKRRGVALFD